MEGNSNFKSSIDTNSNYSIEYPYPQSFFYSNMYLLLHPDTTGVSTSPLFLLSLYYYILLHTYFSHQTTCSSCTLYISSTSPITYFHYVLFFSTLVHISFSLVQFYLQTMIQKIFFSSSFVFFFSFLVFSFQHQDIPYLL